MSFVAYYFAIRIRNKMKQSVFVKLNQEKWKEYEQKLKQNVASADELSKMYVHLTEDLAYSKARYPKTELTRFLNNLSLTVHNKIYRNKPEEKNRIIRFYQEEVPMVMATSGRAMFHAFLILMAGVFLGAVSSANDQTFTRLILSDGYVDMTIRNIQEGQPMGVYSSMDQISMFFFITVNNIRVSFIAFIFGILTSFAVGAVLFRNGIMLGAFHYLFYEYGLFDATILTIWLHGTIEITSIVIAGGAGLIMGNGLLFPGTYSRGESFRRAGKKGLKIIIGLVPFFIIAGFIESFITRYADMPLVLKLLIIFGSLFLLAYYFLWKPYKVTRNVNS